MRAHLVVRWTVALAFASLLLGPTAASAALPPGPRLTFLEIELVLRKDHEVKAEEEGARIDLTSVDAEGHGRRGLALPSVLAPGGPNVSWSADGSKFAFRAQPRRLAGTKKVEAYVAAADGSGAHAVAQVDFGPVVLSPDGRWLAFARRRVSRVHPDDEHPQRSIEELAHRFVGVSTWIVPTEGGRPRRLTPWRDDLFAVPSSFTPDGSTLAVSVERFPHEEEVDAIDLASGREAMLKPEASEAAYSPDGSQISFSSYRDHETVDGFDGPEATSDLYVAAADGTGVSRITRTPDLQEGAPSWDPSGSRLAYSRSPGGLLGFLKATIVESNADGSCPLVLPLRKPRRKRGSLLIGAPTWVSGEGRSVAPLSC